MKHRDPLSEKEKMISGELYRSSDAQLIEERMRARTILNEFNIIPVGNASRRIQTLEAFFGKVGKNPYIEPIFYCDYGYNIEIGDEFYANYNCVILDVCRVTIGRNALLGPSVHIYTASHPLESQKRISGLELGKPVTIGDDVWIGGGAIINPGISIGNRSVIASGSVVTRNVPPDVLVGGNPARFIKKVS